MSEDENLKKARTKAKLSLLAVITIILLSLSLAVVIGLHPISSAKYQERAQDFKGALATYDKGLDNSIYAVDPQIYVARAYCLRRLKRYDEGIASLEKADELHAKYPTFFWMVGSDHSPVQYRILIERGWNYYARKQYQEALKCFDQALAIMQMDSAYQGRASCYEEMGELKKAEAEYKRATEHTVACTRERAHHEVGSFYRRQKRYDEALKWLDKAQTYEACAGVNREKALIFWNKGDLDKASEQFHISLSRQRDPRVFADRAQLRREKGDGQGALEDIQSARQMDPDNPVYQEEERVILSETGKLN